MESTADAGLPDDGREHQGEATTTHAGWGEGDPRLLVTGEGVHHTHLLRGDRVRIGSGPDCDLRLEGLEALHAEIDHDTEDEYVLVLRGPAEDSSGSPRPLATVQTEGEVLRTGAQFTLGPWRFVFVRAEFADHGRPYGGREGGEGAHQQPQPPRPRYAHLHPTSEDNARAEE